MDTKSAIRDFISTLQSIVVCMVNNIAINHDTIDNHEYLQSCQKSINLDISCY